MPRLPLLLSLAFAIAQLAFDLRASHAKRAVFFPAEFQSRAGPTPTFSYVTPSILALETGKVPGTPASKLYLPEGKRIWNTQTGELLYGDLLDADEIAALDYSADRNEVLYQDTHHELTLFDLTRSEIVARLPVSLSIQGASYIAKTDLALISGYALSSPSTLCLDLQTGERVWQSELYQRTHTHHLKDDNRFIEIRRSHFSTDIVKTWNASSGELLGSIEATRSETRDYEAISNLVEIEKLYSIATSPTESLILNAVTGDSFTLEEDLNERYHLYSLSSDAKKMAVYYPTSNRFELRSASNGALLFDIKSARASEGMSDSIRWFDFSPDGTRLYITDAERRTTEWDTANMRLRRIALPPTQLLTSIGLTPDGKYLITANSTKPALDVWDIGTGEKQGSISISSQLTHASVAPDSSSITLLVAGGIAHTYSLPNCQRFGSFPDDQGLAYVSGYVSSRDSFLSFYHNGQIEERSATDLSLIGTHQFLRRINEVYAVDPYSGYILIFDVFSQVVLFDPFTNRDLQSYPASPSARTDFGTLVTTTQGETKVILSGRQVQNGTSSHRISIHTATSSTPTEVIELDKASKRIELSPDAKTLAFSTFNENYSTPESLLQTKKLGAGNTTSGYTLPGNIDDLAFSADSDALFALWHDSDSKLKISRHNPDTGELLETIFTLSERTEGRTSPLGIITLFPDGEKALVATAQSVLHVVDLESGAILASQRTRPDTPGYYSSLEALRFASVSNSGSRILYHDAQGLQDSWLLSEGRPYPLEVFLSSNTPMLSIDTTNGETYLIELSKDLSQWEEIQKFTATTDEARVLSIPEAFEQNVFLRAYSFIRN